MNVGAVMAGLGTRLRTISGLRVHDYAADQVSPPTAVVALPEVTFDSTMARGSDDAEFPIHVLVGKVSDRASATKLAAYLSGGSVKAAIEADPTLAGACQTLRVESASPSVMTVAGVDYLAATFTVNVVASGG